jgi:6-phosphogluconolactonase
VASPDNRYVYVPDLGIDRIVVYEFDENTGGLKPRPELDVVTPPGSGPRHLTFDPEGEFAYASLELTSELAVYHYNNGSLVEIGRHSTLPEGFDGPNTTAEVRTAPDGRSVYISNRGDDSLALFHRASSAAPIEKVDAISTRGKTPRNFGIDPSGNFLVAANQNSHTLVVFKIDRESGRLSDTGSRATIPFPVFLCFDPIH